MHKIRQTIRMMNIWFRLPSVIGLFFWSCPSTIFWFVIPIIIYSVDRMRLGWFSSHVFYEIFKFHPSLAYLNAPSSVILIFWIIGIITSSFQQAPRVILRNSSFSTSRHSMGSPSTISKKFSKNTAAAFYMAIKNTINSACHFISAITLTFKKSASFYLMGKLNNKKSIELLSGNISWFWTVWHEFNMPHTNYLYER